MMLESLHFAVFRPDQYAFRACFFESLAGTRHLNLLESIRDDDRHAFAFQIIHRLASLPAQ